MVTPDPVVSRRAERALVAALLVAAAALRGSGLGEESLWVDEAWSTWLARGSVSTLVDLVRLDVHPPLYYLLLLGWTRLAGLSEVALRLPSALFGVATVGAVYLLGRRWAGPRVGVVAAALVAVSPFQVHFAQEARSYTLLALLATLATGAYLRLLEADRWRHRLAYLGATWLLLSTHYLGLLVAAAHGVAFLLLQVAPGRTAPPLGVRPWLRVTLAVGVAFLPGAMLLCEQLTALPEGFWIPPPSLSTLLDLGRLLLGLGAPPVPAVGNWGLFMVATGVALGLLTLLGTTRVGGALLARTSSREAAVAPGWWFTVLAAWLAVPVLVGWGLSWVGVEVFTTRNLIVTAPPFALLAAAAVLRIPAALPRTLALAALLGVPVASLAAARGDVAREGWRDAGTVVKALARPGDAFVVDEWFVRPALEYYLGREVDPLPPWRGEVAGRSRVWLVRSHSRDAIQARRRALERLGFRVWRRERFPGVEVTLLVRPVPGAPPG